MSLWLDDGGSRQGNWNRRYTISLFLLLAFATSSTAVTNADDKQALIDLFHATNGNEWTEGFRWARGVEIDLDPCDDSEFFKGVSCTGTLLEPDRRVQSLLLSYLNLNGTLPESLGSLTYLESMYITANSIEGHIPQSFCNMTMLQTFDAAKNFLTGPIPTCVGDLQNLIKLDLRSNRLTGTIPPGFGKILQLQQLFLSENQLSGTIPADLYNARRLEKLLLSYNQLTGTIPQVWSRFKMKETVAMTGLNWLDVRGNQLTGTYPTVVADFGAV
mmetsp:Transcript_27397/g.56071  ORF Transcript_27397/g.56071 Transcript_27397/m.56071 type:complete len:273 (+) Transcript_27397:99-917(+)|eukprot:CAMPEP_0181323594 /NCGR_PEP_ID=MMETSP1101-20121128/19877_1 /TAXON_ID=46948 /ORGANISM="Rhodomonas abbreviata, Strain Caron Lab Isolate" /LENGTH=272 /DNA_ID=CAMNT_0023431649 /DNA_START=93 /DNA_END=911 /DNA_ORIENTATION=-